MHHFDDQDLAPLIAVVGADGSGKTTVCNALLLTCCCYGNTEIVHLGMRSGALGRWIRSLPVIGPALFKSITKNGSEARNKDKAIPGITTALVIYAFSALRLARFKRVLKLRKKGVIVLTDRYPQTDVPGFFDGPGLSAARAQGALTIWLAARERKQFDWMVSHSPSLVIRLSVDIETAFARKQDHNYASLKAKIEAVPKLTYGDAEIIELDSRDPLDKVTALASAAVSKMLQDQGYSLEPYKAEPSVSERPEESCMSIIR